MKDSVSEESSAGDVVLLLVEDDNAVRETTQRRLARAGYTVMSAASGEEAVALSWTTPPSLLITDVRMPGMSGPALAERLCASHPRLKVLFLCGDVSGSALPPGALALQKPFTGADLERTIHGMLAADDRR